MKVSLKKMEIFFCDNVDIKSTSEGLDKDFEVHLFGRNSKKQRAHKINIKNIKINNNFYSYLLDVYKTLKKDNSKYLIISLSPYTFLTAVFLRLFKKKLFVYLRSDGYGEYKAILGFPGIFVYHLMFSIASHISLFISCRKYILRKKFGEVVLPSQLNSNWLINHKKPNLEKIRLLYVGRIRKEKGVFSLLKLIKKIEVKLNLTIVGAEKDFDRSTLDKNINIFDVESDEKKLIEHYDNHNIFILPSFTEGHPMALLEALSRMRPVIIFKEIHHVIENKKGIFISNRDSKSLKGTIDHIMKNYLKIQNDMKKNKLPLKSKFISDIKNIILKKNLHK